MSKVPISKSDEMMKLIDDEIALKVDLGYSASVINEFKEKKLEILIARRSRLEKEL